MANNSSPITLLPMDRRRRYPLTILVHPTLSNPRLHMSVFLIHTLVRMLGEHRVDGDAMCL